ncbi:MAG: WD40 repeat domain-containing protein [Prochlorococcaceae cyanobacterium]|jgi:hypothetical protein
MTLISLAVGGLVGVLVGGLVLWSRRARPRGEGVLRAAVWGSFLGTFLLGLLLVEANPASLIGGPFGGLWLLLQLLLFVPGGSITGAAAGVVLASGALPGGRLPRLLRRLTLGAYLVSAVVLSITLAPPAVLLHITNATGSFPLVAKISGYATIPLDLALNERGDQLAVLSSRHGRQRLDRIDLLHRRVRAVRTGHAPLLRSNDRNDQLLSIAFAPDGASWITAAIDQVPERDLVSGRPLERFAGADLAFPLAEGRLLSLGQTQHLAGQVQAPGLLVWDRRTGRRLKVLPAELLPSERRFLPIAVSPDGRRIAFPPRLFGDRIEVWDSTTLQRLTTLKLPQPAGILALAFAPDGRQLAVSLGQDPPLSIWDLGTAATISTIDSPERVDQLYWSDRGILTGSTRGFEVWDPRSGVLRHTLSPAAAPALSALSGDGSTLAAYLPDGWIAVWQVGNGAQP